MCEMCGTELVGRQRRFCSARCGTKKRVRVHRGAELSAASLRYSIVDVDAGSESGGAYAFGVLVDFEVAEILNEDRERWRHLGRR
jgi:predicted nucleic acid-binding Zn ribbon protein